MAALAPHRPWCAETGHNADTPCISAPLRTAGAVPGYADQIIGATLSLADDHGGVPLLSVFTVHAEDSLAITGFSLRPEQIRPLAMALLAHDALLAGDTAAAVFYSAEARRGQDGQR